MELRDSIRTFRQYRVLALVIILIVIAAGLGWAIQQPVRFSASTAFAVNRINQEATPDYQYDGYYALQAADIFSQTVVSWLQTPSVLVEIYERAGLSTDVPSYRTLTSRFKAKKYSAQNIVVTFSTGAEDESRRLAAALTSVLAERTEAVNRTADNRALFQLQPSDPVIVESRPDLLTVGIAGLVVGLALALFIVPLRAYFANPAPIR